MKKQVFYQISILLYIVLAVLLSIAGCCIWLIVWSFLNYGPSGPAWITLVIAAPGAAFMLYCFVKMAKNRIILYEEKLYVPGYWGSKDEKIQFKTEILYSKIDNIFLVVSTNNSLNKKAYRVFTPMPYIVFDCKDGGQKAVNVFYYSKKQVIKIIDESILRAKATGNELQLKTGAEMLADFIKEQKTRNAKR